MDLCSSLSNNQSSASSFNDLPNDLVADILSRLPVKTVVQSTSVNKLWYSIIKNPSFISAHFSHSISDLSNYYILVIHHCSPPLVNLVSHNHVLTRHPNFNLPFNTMNKVLVIGTCNGLLCLTDSGDNNQNHFGRDIFLINPFIHKYKKLGAESSCYPDLIYEIDGIDNGKIRVAFYYSEADNDYKIFRILVRYDPTGQDPTGPRILLKKVEIYSLKTGQWRSMDVLVDQIPIHCSPTFLNGCLYWLPETSSGPLICFDLNDQLFSKINLPTAYVELFPMYCCIQEKNCTVTLCNVDPESMCFSKRFCLLVLEKDIDGLVQWKKFFYITNEFIPSNCIGFSGCGRFIFMKKNALMDYNWSIVATDLNNSFALEMIELDFFHIDFTSVINVMESLAMFLD